MSKIGYLRLQRAFKSVYRKHNCLGFCKGIRVPEPSPNLATNDSRIRKGWLLQWTISSTVWLWLSYVRRNPWTNSATSMGSYRLRMINMQRALQSDSQKCKLVSTIPSLHINQKQIGPHLVTMIGRSYITLLVGSVGLVLADSKPVNWNKYDLLH